MVKAFVTGGYFDTSGEGVLWEIDLAEESAEVVLRWTPPESLRVPAKGFAGGSLGEDGLLYACAHTAVVRIDPLAGKVTGTLHQPCMNDLHHVACFDGRLWVANTGLGAVDVFGYDGRFHGSHALLPAWANARRIGGADPESFEVVADPGWSGAAPGSWSGGGGDDGYHAPDRQAAPFHRLKVRDHLHVNHVVRVGERTLATCFGDGTLRDLRAFEVIARFDGSYLHDGVAIDDEVWLTAIDGSVFGLDAATLRPRRRFAVFDTGHHGWCRGLAVTPEHLLVGMTEVRAGRLPRHRWSDRAPEGSETCVLLLDREDGRLLARIDLTDHERHAKIYSVLPTGLHR